MGKTKLPFVSELHIGRNMQESTARPVEILNIETSHLEKNPHSINTPTLLNITYIRNLIGKNPSGNTNINICAHAILNEYNS